MGRPLLGAASTVCDPARAVVVTGVGQWARLPNAVALSDTARILSPSMRMSNAAPTRLARAGTKVVAPSLPGNAVDPGIRRPDEDAVSFGDFA